MSRVPPGFHKKNRSHNILEVSERLFVAWGSQSQFSVAKDHTIWNVNNHEILDTLQMLLIWRENDVTICLLGTRAVLL